MTPEEIASALVVPHQTPKGDIPLDTAEKLKKSIAMSLRKAVLEEREACAKIADNPYDHDAYSGQSVLEVGDIIATAIHHREKP